MGGLNVSKRNGGAEERGVCVKNKGDSFVCSSKGHNKVVIVREKNEGNRSAVATGNGGFV